MSSSSGENLSGAENEGDGSDEEESTAIELVHVSEDFFYMAHVMRIAAALHSIISFAMLIAYYHLKVIPSSTSSKQFSIINLTQNPISSGAISYFQARKRNR